MADYNKLILSGSVDGKQIKVTGVNTAASVLIHTAIEGTVGKDEIWLYATNSQATQVDLALEWGGVVVPDDLIKVSIPGKAGLFLVIPGLTLQNSRVITAFASVANVLMISGYVNRITV
jgi:hypothetical protein